MVVSDVFIIWKSTARGYYCCYSIAKSCQKKLFKISSDYFHTSVQIRRQYEMSIHKHFISDIFMLVITPLTVNIDTAK